MNKEKHMSIGSKMTRYSYLFIAIIFFMACNKDVAMRLLSDDPKEFNIATSPHKVAYLIMEGGVGRIVGQEANDYGQMPMLGQLSLESMVSWNAVSDANKDPLTAYADLLIGAEYAKHKVLSSSTDDQLAKYPTIFTRLKENNIVHTHFITSNDELSRFKNDVEQYQLVEDDDAVTRETEKALAQDDATVVVATFSAVDKAGKKDGYNSKAYRDALGSFDQRLKKIVDVITHRKKYAQEKWLIIVASPKAGAYTLKAEEVDGTVFSDTERNNFVLIYHNQFAFKFFDIPNDENLPWTRSAVKFTGSGVKGIIKAKDASIYNIEKDREYTIELKIKVHSYGNLNQTVFAKRASTNGSQNGWALLIGREDKSGKDISSGSFRVKVNGLDTYASGDVALDIWHAVAFRVYMDGKKQMLTMFRDGKAYSSNDISSLNGSSDDDLELGYTPGYASNVGKQSHSIADIRIYNIAKIPAAIQSSYCTTISTAENDPYHDNLIGYWPGDDRLNELLDHSKSKRNFAFEGTPVWADFSDQATNICPPTSKRKEEDVFRSIDITRLVYSWFNFLDIARFDIDGKYWSPSFKTTK